MNDIVPYADLEKMAGIMAKTGMFGKKPDELIALMLIAQAEGLHPARAAQDYDVIQGRPALKSQAALSRFQESGGRVKWIERTEKIAKAEFSHPQAESLIIEWTIARAAQMGLAGKDNWKKQPMVMLQWRCVAEGIRACYPACLNRLYLVEEVQDFEPRNVTHELPPEDAAMQDVTDSKGQLSPPSDPGELNPKGDGTRGAMLEYKKQLNDIACAKYPGTEERILSTDDIKDMNAEKHPGGRLLEPSDNDLALLKGIVEKWADRVALRIEQRSQPKEDLDALADEAFDQDRR
jgi:hypothetical protein